MITVIGLGFVGLTTALGFSQKGFKVYGYDINSEKSAMLKAGSLPFYEPHIGEVLLENLNKAGDQWSPLQNKNFTIVDNLTEAVENSQFIFFCVGTPSVNDAVLI